LTATQTLTLKMLPTKTEKQKYPQQRRVFSM